MGITLLDGRRSLLSDLCYCLLGWATLVGSRRWLFAGGRLDEDIADLLLDFHPLFAAENRWMSLKFGFAGQPNRYPDARRSAVDHMGFAAHKIAIGRTLELGLPWRTLDIRIDGATRRGLTTMKFVGSGGAGGLPSFCPNRIVRLELAGDGFHG
ncbi:hypothetical protein ACLOJK_038367 [Asimina triloba]